MSSDMIAIVMVICYTAIDHRHRFTGACQQIVHVELIAQWLAW